jgi:hypothetical protein
MWTYDRILIAEKKCESVKVGDRVMMPSSRFATVKELVSVVDSYLHCCSTCFNVAYKITFDSQEIFIPPVSIRSLCEKCKYFIS